MRDTLIGAGTRIDNLVQIGHNARLGRCCIVVSQAGISGSTELGDFVTVAAQAGLIGHIKIGTKARIGAQCGVMSDVDAGADVIGSPAMPFREFFVMLPPCGNFRVKAGTSSPAARMVTPAGLLRKPFVLPQGSD